MAENIVTSLFGLAPGQTQREDELRAKEFAQMNPFERQNYQKYTWGRQIGRGVGGMLGMVDPQQEQQKQQTQIQSQIDHSTPEGLMKGAQLFNQIGNPRLAYMYQQAADARAQEIATLAKTRAQAEKEAALAKKAGREEDLTKYGRLQKTEVGVEGRPDWRQKALFDPLTGKLTNIGSPYRIPASISAEVKTAAGEAKVTAEERSQKEGKEKVNLQVTTLKDYYDQLLKGGGIVSTKGATGGNVAARIGSTGVGQVIGGTVGTENQRYRDQIKQSRPLLLQAIKKATGMTGKQMDSNVELKMYLAAATDPEIGYEANITALSNLDKLFGLGIGFDTPAESPQAQAAQQAPSDLAAAARAELERRRKGK